jgi:hypothetical protein
LIGSFVFADGPKDTQPIDVIVIKTGLSCGDEITFAVIGQTETNEIHPLSTDPS